jgi:hypothetical protein
MLAASAIAHPKSNVFSLEIAEVAREYALATLGPVLLQTWELGTPEAGAQKARALARSMRNRYAQTISLIVVPERSQLPSEGARMECSRIPRDLPGCQGLALVREGEGFRAAAIRAIMAGMMSFGQAAPYKIVATVTDGCDWLATRMPNISASSIMHARAELQRAWLNAQR